jgi:hypothetical protein
MSGPARHRKPAHLSRQQNAAAGRTVMVAGAAVVLAAGAVVAGIYWSAGTPHAVGEVTALTRPTATAGTSRAASSHGGETGLGLAHSARPSPAHSRKTTRATPKAKGAISGRSAKPALAPTPIQIAPVYVNPLRSITGLILERVDMGADFGGTGPIYAIGDAVITNATASNSGWPGGGWVTYRLTSGPAAGLQVYVAEDVTPAVSVGQTVTAGTVIANMFNGGDGIETGWAMPDGISAESQLAAAGGISGAGPFPTDVGLNFDALLQALGVPAAPNFAPSGYGLLPSNYPTSWSSLTS